MLCLDLTEHKLDQTLQHLPRKIVFSWGFFLQHLSVTFCVKPPSWIPNNLVQLFPRVQLISDCPELAPLDSSIGRLVVFHSDTEVWPITLNLIHEVLQKLVLVNPSTEARVATGLTGGVRGGGGNRGLGLSGYAWSENKWLLNHYFTVPKIWNFFTRYFLLLLLFVQPV